MSNKKILEEATIRRFMKLASIDKLSENFLDTVQEEEQVEEATETTEETVEESEEIEEGKEEVTEAAEETVEEVAEATEETVEEATEEGAETVDEEVQLPEEDDMEGGEEPEAMDMGGEEEAAPAAEADVAAALKTIADALGAAGIDIEVKDDGEDMADEPEMDMGDEPADEEDPMQQELAVAEGEDEEEKMEENDEFLESVANKVLQKIRETLKKNK